MSKENERPRVTIGAIVIAPDKDILLLKSSKWGGRYILPCGHVEFGESLENAVKREVKEESGLEVNNIKFLRVQEFIQSEEYHDKKSHFVGLQYTCESQTKEVKTNNEAEEYAWFSHSEALKRNLEKGTFETIEYYLSSTPNRHDPFAPF